jgi:hypothetical protein
MNASNIETANSTELAILTLAVQQVNALVQTNICNIDLQEVIDETIAGLIHTRQRLLEFKAEIFDFEGAAMTLPEGYEVRQLTTDDLREELARRESLDAEESRRLEVPQIRRDE